ncbi:helix-turn-helix transcriptional regulator [Pseudomonas sp. R2.Fl]|nr:helix-turn-helix transcriptional regulator [Pseudomonas sp. R2.Fl]
MITLLQRRGTGAMLGMTQAKLSTQAGIGTTGFNNIECDSSSPEATILRAYLDTLEVVAIR